MEKTDILIFQVTNTESIESGCAAYFIFDKNGGTIGSGDNNHWVIQDRKKHLPIDLARVEWRDNYYCLLVLGKGTIFINNAEVTSRSGFTRLAKGDVLTFGEINLRVYIEDESQVDLTALSLRPEEIIGNKQDHLKELIGEQQRYEAQYKIENNTIDDSISVDPLVALSAHNNLINENHNKSLDSLASLSSPRKIGSDMSTNTHFMDLPSTKKHSETSEYVENAYVTISPLLREMNVQIPLQNSQDINDILGEVGKTLKVAIDGLLALQQEQNSLSDKHLRPIEDNPLRLNLDYSSTMDILFGNQKSPVHLSAPAAVSESLNNLLIHNEANKVAILSALTAILQAFSPVVLLSRFENYRRSNETKEKNAAWAWEMYENYYQELTSTRQKGFEKLFWEVYAQAYDKSLRDHQNKG